MLCTNCYREAVEGAVFCNHCGTHLQEICDNCATLNPLDSRFCSRCGLSLSSGLQGAESPIYHQPPISSPVQSASCPRCQKVNEPGSAYCYSCGFPLDEVEISAQPTVTQSASSSAEIPIETPQIRQDADVPNHLGWAILATIFCCLPAGIVSIIYAAQVNGKVKAGDMLGARQASDNAKTWAWVSFGLGIVVGLIYFFAAL